MNDSGYGASSIGTSSNKKVLSGLCMFDEYLNTVEIDVPIKSELDIYLEKGFLDVMRVKKNLILMP